jgi:hypothetical protein
MYSRSASRTDAQLFVESKNLLDGHLLFPENRGSVGRSKVRTKAAPSKAGIVVCRKWNGPRVGVVRVRQPLSTLQPFAFDTPSPDDVIRAAQSNIQNRKFAGTSK